MRTIHIAALFTIFLAACNSPEAGQSSTTGAKSATAAATASESASAGAPAEPVAPAVAAVRAGKLTVPGTKEPVALVETSLAKCFGFKGYSIMLPEGSTMETMAGARACAIFMPNAYKKFGLMVMTDEIKVKMWKRTDLENVKKRILDDPDAFLFEVEEKGKSKLTGWLETKLGERTVQCNSMRDDGTMSVDEELAFIELCRTLKLDEAQTK